ncbi:conserved protein of unknown function [Petrocella atlantisensis]|uniref:Uncharacterized protein n=1 Tax=Petrocella atlantisensis TaxID=2173034 RepID=A0A3P7RZ21_9FIRM|nr:DUF3298 domain-containing protein [Petrocella atlantisensis]VDN47926.1 conserved protein of unknown function [Petrocella atlantisensis]
MFRYNRLYTYTILGILLMLIWGLSGCMENATPNTEASPEPNETHLVSSQEEASTEIRQSPLGPVINAHSHVYSVTDNPLEFNYIEEESLDLQHKSYFQILGLKDKNVEDKINTAIYNMYRSYLPYIEEGLMPPFRGYATNPSAKGELQSYYLEVSHQYNSNHVLSILLRLSAEYMGEPGMTPAYYSLYDTLNFDLNTGDELLLIDVFTNDTDGLVVLNDAVMEEVKKQQLLADADDFYGSSLELVAPFKGFLPTQKFYLAYDSLILILDHETPAFNIGFNPHTFSIPLGSSPGNIAINERFYHEEDLFVEEGGIMRFITTYEANQADYQVKEYDEDGIHFFIEYTYPRNATDAVKSLMDTAFDEHKALVLNRHKDQPLEQANLHSYLLKVGPYANISYYVYFYGPGVDGSLSMYDVLDPSGRIMTLSDIFVDGYDYKSAINNHLGIELDYDDPTLSFGISETFLQLTVETRHKVNNSYYSDYYEIPYEVFGYEDGLKIF